MGLDLDSIASVVIGGTRNMYWTKIFIGGMLFLFILLQKAFVLGAGRKRQ